MPYHISVNIFPLTETTNPLHPFKLTSLQLGSNLYFSTAFFTPARLPSVAAVRKKAFSSCSECNKRSNDCQQAIKNVNE